MCCTLRDRGSWRAFRRQNSCYWGDGQRLHAKGGLQPVLKQKTPSLEEIEWVRSAFLCRSWTSAFMLRAALPLSGARRSCCYRWEAPSSLIGDDLAQGERRPNK